MLLAFVVLLVLFCVGPTLNILNMFTNTLGDYIANFFKMSLRIPQSGGDNRILSIVVTIDTFHHRSAECVDSF